MWRHLSWVVIVLACSCRFDLPEVPPRTDASGDAQAQDAQASDGSLLAMCDASACGAAGGTCNPVNGHCMIDQSSLPGVTCPTDHFCDITCSNGGCDSVNCQGAAGCTVVCGAGGSTSECQSGVQCPATGPCTVTCNGDNACRGSVTCGEGPCNVQCLGFTACRDRVVDCTRSAACDIRCIGTHACESAGVACGPGSCDVECNGMYACRRLPACTVTPTQCAFHCCGSNTCNDPLCSTCTRDAVCN